MNISLDHDFFKVYFQQFYAKILYFKNLALTKENLSLDDVNNIKQTLIDILQEQERTIASSTNAFILNIYKELQYIMAGFSDEVFLELDWPAEYKDHWNNHLLEYKLFGSHVAGEKIFNSIESIITKHESQNLLIPIYIYILSLGFYGKYRLQKHIDDEPQEISHYKKQLFDLMYNVSKINLKEENVLFPGTKLHTLINKNIIRNHTMLLWLCIFVGVLAVYCIASYSLWHNQTRSIYTIVNNILNISSIR